MKSSQSDIPSQTARSCPLSSNGDTRRTDRDARRKTQNQQGKDEKDSSFRPLRWRRSNWRDSSRPSSTASPRSRGCGPRRRRRGECPAGASRAGAGRPTSAAGEGPGASSCRAAAAAAATAAAAGIGTAAAADRVGEGPCPLQRAASSLQR